MRNTLFIIGITMSFLLSGGPFEDSFNKGNDLFYKQQFSEALAAYKEARARDDSQAGIHYNIGVTYFELRDFVAAEESLKKALSKNPRHARAALYLGKIAYERGQRDQAEPWFKQALSYDPGLIDAVTPLADILKEKLACEDALIYLRAACERNPQHINLTFNLANSLNMADHSEEALALYLKLSEKLPHDSSINYNIAYTYKKLGQLEEALPYYERTLTLKPDHKEAHFSRGLCYLMLGDWEHGWEGYEYRWDRGDNQHLRNYPEPRWCGEPLAGKHIFVYAEQGLGDTFQFVRYLKILKDQGAYIIFAPQNPLRTILKLCPYIDEVIPFHERPTSFDYWIPLVSLPHVMNTRIDTVPHEIPYLSADPFLEVYWQEKLAQDTNFKIGICWQGNSEYSTAFLRAAVKSKSTQAQLFEPLTHIPGVSVYSLQRITGVDQLATIPTSMKLITFDDQFDNAHGRFMDTAAVMKNLDLIITIDTSICHLAAALGVPVWNLLPTPADWRWMLTRIDTPWYPNMRLFRQPIQGDWHGLMNEVVQALKEQLLAAQSE
jgi:tetratricopeptide (TPR) repeat protein